MNSKETYNEKIKHSKHGSFKIRETNSGPKKQPTNENCEINNVVIPKKYEEDFEYEYEKLLLLLESLDDPGEKGDLGCTRSDSESDSEDISLGHPNRRLQAERPVQQEKYKTKRKLNKHQNRPRIFYQLLKREKRKGSDLSYHLKHKKFKEDGQSRIVPQLKRQKIQLPSSKKINNVPDIVPKSKYMAYKNKFSNIIEDEKLKIEDSESSIFPHTKAQKLQWPSPNERNLQNIVSKQYKYVGSKNDLSNSLKYDTVEEEGQSNNLSKINRQELQLPLPEERNVLDITFTKQYKYVDSTNDLSNSLKDEQIEDGQSKNLSQINRQELQLPLPEERNKLDITFTKQCKYVTVDSTNDLSISLKDEQIEEDGQSNFLSQINRQELQLPLPKEINVSDVVTKEFKHVDLKSDLSNGLKYEKIEEDDQGFILPQIQIQLPSPEIRNIPEIVQKHCATVVPKDILSDKPNRSQQNLEAKQKQNSGTLWPIFPKSSSQTKNLGNIDVDYKVLLEEYIHCLHKTNHRSQTLYEIRFQEKLMNFPEEKVTASHFLKEFYISPARVEVFHQRLTDDTSGLECLRVVCEGLGWPQPVYKQDHCQDPRAGFVYFCQLKGVEFTSSKPASNCKLAMELAALACLDWLGLQPRRASDKLNTYF